MDIALEQSAPARLITGEERELTVPAKLRYASTDPLAVHLDFPGEVSLDGQGATWTFARCLLESGLRGSAGDGDVHIWPCGPERTVVELHSPYGMALLQFDTCVLQRFLLRTYAAVPAGEEDLGAVVERGLSALFGSV
ncbi:SsgA family sporulation/cell division regulator [Streptomyces sp. HD]|uniref:SsgA family sporulation/cell division regulator n=1 Tax=Streptomyces sp. HD TaxID=3020892 RepID=UPI00232C4A98|nr:SsgA family sporulation/cell division regulator [Streptomyces sp. HD]MDC0769869.1 SsgA family sporulation/cell division regulator [Streptomyces sp. HD]